MRYFLKRDAFFATVMVFLFIFLLSLLGFNSDIFDINKVALFDVKFNDLVFSKFNKQKSLDDRIVIINIGKDQRKKIADVLNKIKTYQPKVVGLDILFLKPKDDSTDNYLSNTITQFPNLVMSKRVKWEKDSIEQLNFFQRQATHSGYVNFISEDGGVIRFYSPFEKSGDQVYNSFSSEILKIANPLAYDTLVNRKNEVELINYQRNGDKYFTIEDSEILNNKIDPSFLKDKIILVGYVDNDPNDVEDKHYTPMNPKFIGKSLPDMNGVIIHANILSMALDNSYIPRIPTWLNIIIAFLLTWVHIAFFIKYYIHKHIWFHFIFKTIQLISSIFFIFLSILFFHGCNLYIDFTLLLTAILVSVDILYIYEGFANWMQKKFSISTNFSKAYH